MPYLFTSESVSEGHPDKIADQISDALVDNFLFFDPESKVACETLVTTGQVIIAGEVSSNVYLDIQKIARDTIKRIGYNKSEYLFEANSCGILSVLHEQSEDIKQGIEKNNPEDQGAGDQGIMFGYASNDTEDYIPLTLYLSHFIVKELADIRKNTSLMPYLRPDGKAQVTIQYDDDHRPIKIYSIVVSAQHDEFASEAVMLKTISNDIKNKVVPRILDKLTPKLRKLFTDDIRYFINPTGKFVIGGPHGDTGLTGRKIIVDTYGGKGSHGGGAFSGKDSSKVDRSASYMARYIAKNIVSTGMIDEVLVQISYCIGMPDPCSIYINTYGRSKVNKTDGEIAEIVKDVFDLRPFAIEKKLKLRQPMYLETAAYGHMGRKNEIVTKEFYNNDGMSQISEIELFTWEKLDYTEIFKDHLKK
ncbi:MAG: methionine adenosyltransferase [Solitalea-like symbiont of Tyrophagus putrescentiae]